MGCRTWTWVGVCKVESGAYVMGWGDVWLGIFCGVVLSLPFSLWNVISTRLIYVILSRPLTVCGSVLLFPIFHALECSAHKLDRKFELICLACLLLGSIFVILS